MKRVKLVTLSAVFIVFFCFHGFAGKTEGIDESPVKKLKVRVFAEGKPVSHLKKEDFKLYEDKILQTIDDVIISKRKIGGVPKSSSSSRCFVLLFDITNYSSQMQNGLVYIFDHLLGARDQLLIAANDQTLFFNNLSDKKKALLAIHRFLAEQSSQTKQRMYADLSAVENRMNLIRTRSSRETDRHGRGAVHLHYYMKYIKFSIEQYIKALQDYKKKYLVPDVSSFCNLLGPLEKVKPGKWVIRFYRIPEIPKLSGKNRGMIKKLISDLQDSHLRDEHYYSELFTKMLGQIDNLFNRAADFPVEAMSQLFYKLDANFFAIVVSGGFDKASQDRKHRGLLIDIESNWAEIARRTGGLGVSMETAPDNIRSTEDFYYTLTYTPKDPGKHGKLKVEVKDKNYKVYFEGAFGTGDFSQYLKTDKDSQTPGVQVKDVTFKNKRFSITITGFLVQKTGKENTGRIAVRIYIKDNRENKILFHQGKTMLPQKDTVHISLSFLWLKKGSYEIGVYVNDSLTGKSVVKAVEAVVD
jgi:hypothetical protein